MKRADKYLYYLAGAFVYVGGACAIVILVPFWVPAWAYYKVKERKAEK